MNVLNLEFEILKPDSNFVIWDKFVDTSPQGSIFCRPWWLQTVCEQDFQILLANQNSKIVGGMALPIKKKYSINYSMMPRFTQSLGPLLLPFENLKYETRISTEMKILDFLISRLPQLSYFSMNCHYNFTNWLPFYWAGYKQTTRYTYVLENLNNINGIYEGTTHDYRNAIKKAMNNGIQIKESNDIDQFIKIDELTYSRKGLNLPYSKTFVKSIISASFQNNVGKIYFAVDKNGDVNAAIFVIYDHASMYNIMQGLNPIYASSGANILLFWEVIKSAGQITTRFDFEGSMIREIELVFRRFGAQQKQYFNISKIIGVNKIESALRFFRFSKILR